MQISTAHTKGLTADGAAPKMSHASLELLMMRKYV